MTQVWVATEGTSHEGDTVLGVFTTEESARGTAERHAGEDLAWRWLTDCWFAPKPGSFDVTSYEVTRWTLDAGSP